MELGEGVMIWIRNWIGYGKFCIDIQEAKSDWRWREKNEYKKIVLCQPSKQKEGVSALEISIQTDSL